MSEDTSVEILDSKFQVFQKLWPILWNWVSFGWAGAPWGFQNNYSSWQWLGQSQKI